MTKSIFTDAAVAGEVIVVTGASRGIGAAILESMVAAGATVVGTATSELGAKAITDRIVDLGGKGRGFVLNVTQRESIDPFVAAVGDEFGKISVLVNNAGITQDTLAMRMKDEQWDAVIDTNLTGTFRLSRACLRDMMKARHGRIINLTSIVGAMGNIGQANYAAAKAGLVAMSKSIAREMGTRGITVNCIAPGFIATDMTAVLPEEQKKTLLAQIPASRLGDPRDIADVAVFLASSAAAYITGQVVHVNGGMLMP